MSFSGGVFTRLYNWVTEQASSPIEISKLDAQEEDIATALSNCILRDGTGEPTADQDWNGQDLTNVAALTAVSVNLSKTGGGQAAALNISAAAASVNLRESDAGADEKSWTLQANGNVFGVYGVNDADSASNAAYTIGRSANVPTRMTLSVRLTLWSQASAPGSAINGDMYYDTATHKFRGYANGSWVDLH